MLVAVLAAFIAAGLAPLIHRLSARAAGWLMASVTLLLFAYLASFGGRIASGEAIVSSIPWTPGMGVDLSFRLDGLSLVMGLLVTGIGALVILYSHGYLRGDPYLGRFYLTIVFFMASMLGLVLADNILLLFVFWELTSFSSFLLIGFRHADQKARDAALTALIVTAGGGLALLGGLVILGSIGGDYELSRLLANASEIRGHVLYLPALILILLGAFTKSAQFPFHFWLPGAMEAPTPVSAYLHSATMVKAGVFLLARLHPVLGGTASWQALVIGFGAATIVVGALLAVQQRDLKRILAYSTVSALGTMVMLLGIGGSAAAKAAILFLIGHALYKGTLFLVAGSVDHETGTRDIERLGGLRRVMPWTALAAGLAGLSMVGFPPLLGFLAKEYVYEAALHAPALPNGLATGLIVLAVAANVLLVVAAAMVAVKPFFGAAGPTPKSAHEAPTAMLVGPLTLSALGLAAGLLPGTVSKLFVTPGTAAVLGAPTESAIHYPTELSLVLGLSVLTLALGALGAAYYRQVGAAARAVDLGRLIGAERVYQASLKALLDGAAAITGVMQNGYLRFYVATVMLSFTGLVGHTLITRVDLSGLADAPPDWLAHEVIIAGLILAGTVVAVISSSRLVAVAGLGVVGYGMALMFVLFSAPDLAMTQFAIETLTVVLFVLVIYRLPRFSILSSRTARIRDVALALTGGGLMTLLVLLLSTDPVASRLRPFFADSSLALGHGRNVVNVILVDFRSLDTLGEIVVLAVAAIGVYALMEMGGPKWPARFRPRLDAATEAEAPEETER